MDSRTGKCVRPPWADGLNYRPPPSMEFELRYSQDTLLGIKTFSPSFFAQSPNAQESRIEMTGGSSEASWGMHCCMAQLRCKWGASESWRKLHFPQQKTEKAIQHAGLQNMRSQALYFKFDISQAAASYGLPNSS